jgi:hypothetical protein
VSDEVVELAERELAGLVGITLSESLDSELAEPEANELDNEVNVGSVELSRVEEPGVSRLVAVSTTELSAADDGEAVVMSVVAVAVVSWGGTKVITTVLPPPSEELLWLAGGRRLESDCGSCLGWCLALLPRGPASATAASDRACNISVEVRIFLVMLKV